MDIKSSKRKEDHFMDAVGQTRTGKLSGSLSLNGYLLEAEDISQNISLINIGIELF